MSTLSTAVKFHQDYEEAVKDAENPSSLVFEDRIGLKWVKSFDEIYFWYPQGATSNSSLYSYELEYRGPVDEDENFIMYFVNNGCGETFNVVFSKADESDEEV